MNAITLRRLIVIVVLQLCAVTITHATPNIPYDFVERSETECKTVKQIDRVLRYDNVLLFANGDSPELYSLKIGKLSDKLKIVKVSSLSKSLKFIRSGFHYNLVKACSNLESNPRFCRISKLFNNHVIFFGESATSRNRKFAFEFFNNTGLTLEESYEDGKLISTDYMAPKPSIEHGDAHRLTHDGGVLELKVKQILYTFYINYLHNQMLDFKGITYEHEADALYTIADVIPDNIAKDKIGWRIGKHVMFRANFSPHGLIQDSYHAAHFDEPKTGIFSHNGAIYVLNGDGTHFDEYRADIPTGKVFTLREMFCLDTSPLSSLVRDKRTPDRNERAREYNDGNIVPNMAQFLFPHIPDFVRIMEPPFLQGYSFYTLTVFLSFAFVIMCVINFFTIMEDIKIDRKLNSRMKRILPSRARRLARRERKRASRISRLSSAAGSGVRSTSGQSSTTVASDNPSALNQKSALRNSSLVHRKNPSQTSILPSLKKNPSQPDIYRSYSKQKSLAELSKNYELSQEEIERDSSPGNYPDDK